jgi:hypothetical protein
MDAWKKAERVDTALSLVDRLKQVAEATGVDGLIKATIFTALSLSSTAAIRILNHLPFWADYLLGLTAGIGVMHLWILLRRAWSLRGLKKLDIALLGKDCIELHADILRFLVDRMDGAPKDNAMMTVNHGAESIQRAMHKAWEQRARHGNQTRARVAERFAARSIAISHMLTNAGIQPPNLWSFDFDSSSVAAYVGAIGELLSRGLLAEARQFGPEEVRAIRLHM